MFARWEVRFSINYNLMNLNKALLSLVSHHIIAAVNTCAMCLLVSPVLDVTAYVFACVSVLVQILVVY